MRKRRSCIAVKLIIILTWGAQERGREGGSDRCMNENMEGATWTFAHD